MNVCPWCPKGSKLFDVHMAYNIKMKDGIFGFLVGCNMTNADDDTGYVGGMKGKTGAYEDRYGNFSQIGTGDPSVGSGQWIE